jgi:predicted NAD/FAD-binding protein
MGAQHRLPELNDGTLAFAGAYHGWGFHEDGCRAGVAAAASLGVTW